MAYSALMKIDGVEFKVRHCSYSLHQNVDETGRPMSDVIGGLINVETESTDKTFLYKWMIDPVDHKNGIIEFSKVNEEGVLKKVEFEDAYLTGYTESMHSTDNRPMVENFQISARKIKVQGEQHENIWE
ncbi:MAG: type VI secretion system tube protein TssD [Chitinophagales bacterium]